MAKKLRFPLSRVPVESNSFHLPLEAPTFIDTDMRSYEFLYVSVERLPGRGRGPRLDHLLWARRLSAGNEPRDLVSALLLLACFQEKRTDLLSQCSIFSP